MTDTNELLRDLERALVAISGPYRYEPTTSLPALSPQMQAALDAEAQMVAMVLKRAREVEAELQAARAEVERLRAELRAVATIAHEGGLAQLSEGPPLTAIRRRTLCWWVRTGSLADAQARVRAAMKHKETNQ